MGLQARAFLDGRLETFFPAQPYGGTAETALVSVSFSIFGVGWFGLKIVPILLHLVACVVVWRTAIRLTIDRAGALAAPVILWLGSAFGVRQSIKERGFYGVGIVLAALVLLLVVRLHAHPQRRDMVLLGLCGGLCFWSAPILLAGAVPPAAWLLVRRPALVRHVPLAVLGALIGAVPWLVWNVRNGWASVGAPNSFGTTWWGRFGDWTERLTTVAGANTPWETGRALIPQPLALIALVALVALATWRTRARTPGLLVTSVLGFGVIYSFNGLTVAVGPDPRYLYPLLPVLALVVAAAVSGRSRWLSATPKVLLVAVVGLAMSTWGLVGMRDVAERDQPDPFLASPGLDEAIDLLDDRGVTAAVTDVAGHQITFATDSEIRASTYGVPRFPDLEREGRGQGSDTYVLRVGHMGGDEQRLETYLQANDIAYERSRLGAFMVFLLDEPVPPEDVPLTTFLGPVTPLDS